MLLEYVDHRASLDPALCRTIERELAESPELRKLLAALEATRPDSEVWRVFDDMLDAPVPRHLEDFVRTYEPSQPVPSERAEPVRTTVPGLIERLRDFLFPSGQIGAPAMAFAALVAVGVTSGVLLFANRDVAVGAQVAAALETLPSARFDNQASPGAVIPTGTFESKDGRICRRYAVAATGAEPAYAGIACHKGSKWLEQARGPVTPDQTGGGAFIPSTGPAAAAFDATLKRLMSGDLMEPTDEQRVMARGWTR